MKFMWRVYQIKKNMNQTAAIQVKRKFECHIAVKSLVQKSISVDFLSIATKF